MSRPLAVVTGASSGIGYELAAICAAGGLRPAGRRRSTGNPPGGRRIPRRWRDDVRPSKPTWPRLQGVDRSVGGGRRPSGRRAAGQCRPRPRQGFPRSGLRRCAPRHRHQRHRHDLPDPAGRARHAGARRGPHPDHRIDRRLHARAPIRPSTTAPRRSSTPSRSRCATSCKDSGVTVTCLMPGATETDFFERADMLDTKVGQAKKDDPADVAQGRLRRDDARRRRRRQRLEEQAAVARSPTSPRPACWPSSIARWPSPVRRAPSPLGRPASVETI